MLSRERRRQPAAVEHSSLRWAVSIAAWVHEYGSCPLAVGIVDLSTSGCRFWAGFRLTEQQPIRLIMPAIAPIRAQVAWSDNGYAAAAFLLPLHMSVLRHLVATNPPDPDGPDPRVQARVMAATAPALP